MFALQDQILLHYNFHLSNYLLFSSKLLDEFLRKTRRLIHDAYGVEQIKNSKYESIQILAFYQNLSYLISLFNLSSIFNPNLIRILDYYFYLRKIRTKLATSKYNYINLLSQFVVTPLNLLSIIFFELIFIVNSKFSLFKSYSFLNFRSAKTHLVSCFRTASL